MSRPSPYERLKNPQIHQDVYTDADRVVYFPAGLSLGNFYLTTTETGSLVSAPVSTIQASGGNLSTIVSEAPPAATPSRLVLDVSGMTIEQSQAWGQRVALQSLLTNLLDTTIFIQSGVEMSLRSLFGSLLASVGSVTAAVADISGVRIPNIVTEQLSNAALDEARLAAQALKDAAQDASGVLVALAASSAAADIAAVSGRVTALESAPGFDATSINSAIASLQSDVANKADTSALASYALGSDLSALDGRVTTAEGAISGHGSRLDAVESAVTSKVAQADYDVYVASNDAAVAAVVADVATKASSADVALKADASAVDAKGLLTKVETVSCLLAGLNSAYWGGEIANNLRPAWDAGKLVEASADTGASFFVEYGSKTAGAAVRIRNVGSGAFTFNMGSGGAPLVAVEIQAGETLTLVSNGSDWRLV